MLPGPLAAEDIRWLERLEKEAMVW